MNNDANNSVRIIQKKNVKKANNKFCLICDFNLLTINSMSNELDIKTNKSI